MSTSEPSTADGPVLAAARVTVAELRSAGHLGVVDSARVASFLALAAAVDGRSAGNSQMWRELRELETTLRKGIDEGATSVADEVRGILSAALGDPAKPGTPDVRPASRRRGKAIPAAGAGADAVAADGSRRGRGVYAVGRGGDPAILPASSSPYPEAVWEDILAPGAGG